MPEVGRWCTIHQRSTVLAGRFLRGRASATDAWGMKSRIHPKYQTKYRVTNWAEYDKALVRRGDITLWISEEAIEAWTPARSGKRGAPRKYSDMAIETALTLRLVYGFPLLQAEGYLRSLLNILGRNLDAPDHTTISRRSR